MRRIESWFRDFQRKQEPPLPPGGLRPKELMLLLGRFLDVSGGNPNAVQTAPARPLSIGLSEDRVLREGEVWDEARIDLELKPDFDGDELECSVTAVHEVLGDSSLRIVERSEAVIEDELGAVLAKGIFPSINTTLKKGEPRVFVARARADEISTARLRVAVEEI
jgi:hypothetical protein